MSEPVVLRVDEGVILILELTLADGELEEDWVWVAVGTQLGDALGVEETVGESDRDTVAVGEPLTLGVCDPVRDGGVGLRLAVGGVREELRVEGV